MRTFFSVALTSPQPNGSLVLLSVEDTIFSRSIDWKLNVTGTAGALASTINRWLITAKPLRKPVTEMVRSS